MPTEGKGIMKCAHYDYTDISPAFFDSARSRFESYSNIMDFRTFNVPKAHMDQSFKEGSYGLIVASHVMPATENLHASLSNIRKTSQT